MAVTIIVLLTLVIIELGNVGVQIKSRYSEPLVESFQDNLNIKISDVIN